MVVAVVVIIIVVCGFWNSGFAATPHTRTWQHQLLLHLKLTLAIVDLGTHHSNYSSIDHQNHKGGYRALNQCNQWLTAVHGDS